MSIITRLFGAQKPTPQPTHRRKKLPADIIPDPQYRVTMQMDNLKAAADQALDVYNPNRNELLLLYFQAAKDGHVLSQLEIAVNKVASLPFRIYQGETENEDLKYLFKRPWFDSYIRLMIEVELWGYTLLEFDDMKEGEFMDVHDFPRRWVIPQHREIISTPSALTGIKYDGLLNDLYMIEAGDPLDLGKLEIITREVIWKNFARVDWSDFNERFGKPILDIATDTDDAEEVRKRATMAAGFGSNLWIVRDIDDQVNILEAKNVGGNAQNFEKKIRMCNEEISKLINGQSGTSDEKSFVGSAEVGERILNDFTKARVRRISNHINYALFPFLIYHGYPLQDCTFEFVIEEKQTKLKDQEQEDVEKEPVNRLQKKKYSPGDLRLDMREARNAASLSEWLLRYFEGRVLGIDQSVWRITFERLVDAMQDASISFEANYQYADLATELRQNAAVFAAFKNHKEQSELAALLVDADGKPVDWNTFRKAAKPITEKYNREWLRTEFEQAKASAQMAVKWETFQENADLYPNLRYDAVMDSSTRPAHARMDGTVLPINHKFWNRHYPPNGWGCRCNVTQTDEPATKNYDEGDVDPGFDHNPGKDRKLFSATNGYQADVPETESVKITAQADALLNDYLRS